MYKYITFKETKDCLKLSFIETTPRWKYSMLAMDKDVVFAVKSMDKTRLTITRIGALLSLGIILEIASLVALTDALPTSMDLSDNTYEAVKRAGFVGMRGKKSDAEEDANALSQLMSSHQVWEPALSNHKRAGFVGMRGKKSYGFDNQGDLLQYLSMLYQQQPVSRNLQGTHLKRAGFVGMRGKKSATGDESVLQKRAAFVGMRGPGRFTSVLVYALSATTCKQKPSRYTPQEGWFCRHARKKNLQLVMNQFYKKELHS